MLIQVGELSRRAGISVRTLHHYEHIGLLLPSARSAAGYRLYNLADVKRLHMIQALAKAGMELAAINDYLAQETRRWRNCWISKLQCLISKCVTLSHYVISS